MPAFLLCEDSCHTTPATPLDHPGAFSRKCEVSAQTAFAGQPSCGEALDNYYRRFFEMEVPAGTSASRAWFGQIRPFKNDDDARKLLRLLDRDTQVDIDGRNSHSSDPFS